MNKYFSLFLLLAVSQTDLQAADGGELQAAASTPDRTTTLDHATTLALLRDCIIDREKIRALSESYTSPDTYPSYQTGDDETKDIITQACQDVEKIIKTAKNQTPAFWKEKIEICEILAKSYDERSKRKERMIAEKSANIFTLLAVGAKQIDKWNATIGSLITPGFLAACGALESTK